MPVCSGSCTAVKSVSSALKLHSMPPTQPIQTSVVYLLALAHARVVSCGEGVRRGEGGHQDCPLAMGIRSSVLGKSERVRSSRNHRMTGQVCMQRHSGEGCPHDH